MKIGAIISIGKFNIIIDKSVENFIIINCRRLNIWR